MRTGHPTCGHCTPGLTRRWQRCCRAWGTRWRPGWPAWRVSACFSPPAFWGGGGGQVLGEAALAAGARRLATRQSARVTQPNAGWSQQNESSVGRSFRSRACLAESAPPCAMTPQGAPSGAGLLDLPTVPCPGCPALRAAPPFHTHRRRPRGPRPVCSTALPWVFHHDGARPAGDGALPGSSMALAAGGALPCSGALLHHV
jgi:hypothetical protein